MVKLTISFICNLQYSEARYVFLLRDQIEQNSSLEPESVKVAA